MTTPSLEKSAQRETCPHWMAEIQRPGSTWKGGVWRTKYRCPDCGAWWITEKEDR